MTPEQWKRIDELVQAAVELPPSEQAAFLDEACAGNKTLRQEIESLLIYHQEAKSFLEVPAIKEAAALMGENQVKSLEGQIISHYRIIKPLGQGGMGNVYLAYDIKLGRQVAIKFILTDSSADASAKNRFIHEARAAAKLDHANICGVYDVAEYDGMPYIVMQYVEGETLADRLERAPLALDQAISIATQTADALADAHRCRIIHRDIKPANIMLTYREQVKVLDFGLAKQVRTTDGDTASQSTNLTASMTATGMIMGTPAYMSPEQAMGESVDARSDIFSFGTLVYEILTGERAFSGATPPAVMQAILNNNPPSPKHVRSEIPLELNRLVMKSLQKDKNLRQQSMEEICADLKQLNARLSSSSITFATSPIRHLRDTAWHLRAWAARNRRKSFAISAILILGLLFAIGFFAVRWRSASAVDSASRININTEASPYELFEQGRTLLERYDKDENREAAFKAFQLAISKDQNYAPAHAGLALAYIARFQFDRDKLLLDYAINSAKHAVELDGQLAINRTSLGRAYVERGDYEAAESELKRALTLDPNNADAYRGLAALQQARENWTEAESLYKKAIELHPKDWDIHLALGNLYYVSSRYSDASKAYNEAINLAPDCYMGYRNLGATYYMQGDFAEASTEFQKALQIRPSATVYSNLGTSLFYQGLYQQSIDPMEMAVKLQANNYRNWANLGDAYRWTPGNEEKAREAFLSATRLVRNELSNKPDDADLQSRLALYLAKSGENAQALNEAESVKSRSQNAQVLARLVLVYEICDQRARALEAMAGALKAGHPVEEFSRDPELIELRKDPRYHKLVVRYSPVSQN